MTKSLCQAAKCNSESPFRFLVLETNKQLKPNRTETVLKNADKLVRQVGMEMLNGDIMSGIN